VAWCKSVETDYDKGSLSTSRLAKWKRDDCDGLVAPSTPVYISLDENDNDEPIPTTSNTQEKEVEKEVTKAVTKAVEKVQAKQAKKQTASQWYLQTLSKLNYVTLFLAPMVISMLGADKTVGRIGRLVAYAAILVIAVGVYLNVSGFIAINQDRSVPKEYGLLFLSEAILATVSTGFIFKVWTTSLFKVERGCVEKCTGPLSPVAGVYIAMMGLMYEIYTRHQVRVGTDNVPKPPKPRKVRKDGFWTSLWWYISLLWDETFWTNFWWYVEKGTTFLNPWPGQDLTLKEKQKFLEILNPLALGVCTVIVFIANSYPNMMLVRGKRVVLGVGALAAMWRVVFENVGLALLASRDGDIDEETQRILWTKCVVLIGTTMFFMNFWMSSDY